MFYKDLELSSKMIFNINLRKLLSEYGEFSVNKYFFYIFHEIVGMNLFEIIRS